jgi:hypothetical protein
VSRIRGGGSRVAAICSILKQIELHVHSGLYVVVAASTPEFRVEVTVVRLLTAAQLVKKFPAFIQPAKFTTLTEPASGLCPEPVDSSMYFQSLFF